MSVVIHEVILGATPTFQRPILRLVLPPTHQTARETWITEMTENIIAIRHLDRQSAFEGVTLV